MLKRRLSFALLPGLLLLLVPVLVHAAGDPATDSSSGVLAEFQSKGWLWMYLGALGYGFLTSLTPCVYPMIPITVAIFGARDANSSVFERFGLAGCYVGGMGVMYASIGVVVGLLGGQFGAYLANPWVVIPIVLLFVALAASMFGAFEIGIPSAWQARLNQVGGKGYAGAFGMGLVGGIVAAPCTGPFLAGILAFVATTRDAVVGGTLLFTYAIGIGVLFFAIAVFSLALPKSGRWMEWIKSFCGAALIGVAIHFLRPIVPIIDELSDSSTAFLIGAAGALVLGLVAGGVHLSFHGGWVERIRKAFGLLLMVVGATAMVSWFLTPEQKLPWEYEEQAAFAKARAEGKGVMIDFAATWCAPCKELELTFADPEVFAAITENFVPLKFDVSEGTDRDEELQERWKAETLPAVIFVDAGGTELARVSEYLEPDAFLAVLSPAVERARTRTATTPGAAPAASKVNGTAAKPAAGALAWLTDEAAAYAAARAGAKGVFIDFSSEWCAPCQEMEETFADGEVASELNKYFVPVRFDVSDTENARNKALQAKYRVELLPAMLFVDAGGNELGRITEFADPKTFLAAVAEYSR